MLTVSESVVIPRPPAEVFPVAADPFTQLKWDAGTFKRVEKLDPGPLARGARYRGEAKGLGSFAYEFVDYDPPRRFAHRAVVTLGAVHHVFAFEPVAEGTRLTQSMEVEPKGVGRVLRPVASWLLRRRVHQINAALSRYLTPGTPA